jgi:hypothetical protein
MRQTSYRGYSVSFNRLDRLWYAHDPSRHIRETVVKAPTLEQIKPMVEAKTPNYQAPAFAWMAA